MRSFPKYAFGITVVACTLCGTALGGDEQPPPWQGTGIVGNETHWRWDFFPTAPFIPTGQGPGTPNITGGTWAPSAPGPIGGGDGVYCINPGDTVTIGMPNFPITNDFKYIWIEYHYFGGAEPVTHAFSGGNTASPYGPTVTPSPGPGGGLIGAQGWQFPFNPDFEFITISNPGNAPLYLEWLSISTICAPAPGAAALLLLGTLPLQRRRSR